MSPELTAAYDARASYDAALLQFDDYEPAASPAWILAAVTPARDSGGGVDIDEAGKMTDRVGLGVRAATIKTGTWKALSSSAPTVFPLAESYSWYEPIIQGTDAWLGGPEDRYSPFVDGGIILFRPAPGKTNGEQLEAVRLIFPDWVESVAPAFAFHEANPHLLAPKDPQSVDAAKLVELVARPNPILAVVAFRSLLTLELVPGHWVRARLATAHGHLGAAFSLLTLITAGPHASRPFANETIEAIDTAGVPTVVAIAKGAHAAVRFAHHDRATLSAAKAVLLKARDRLAVLGANVETGSELWWIFQVLGG